MEAINTGTVQETTKAPEGHDEAMAAKFDAAQAPAQAAPETKTTEERPSWLPEKFKSPEDLAKAYSELEKRQGQGKPQEQPKKDGLGIQTEQTPEATPEEAKTELAKVGIDYDALSQKVVETGSLEDSDYESLEKAGIPREMVDSYIDALKSQAAVFELQVKTQFGGEQGWTEMTQWAAQNLAPAEIEAFNKVMDSKDPEQIKLAASGLHSKFTAAVGSEPSLINGGTTAPSTDVFRSTAELTAAMADPRYAKDEAYRQDVAKKLARSSIM